MKAATASQVRKTLRDFADSVRAEGAARYFKTGKGEYGEGDVFIGITVPQSRIVAKVFKELSLRECVGLLKSKVHEERLVALLILVNKTRKASPDEREEIYRLYLQNSRFVNNWDLVDTSAPSIVGDHLFERDRKPLYTLAKSKSLWERRISIIATQSFIRRNDFADTLKIGEILLSDDHDLIHKAVGWMLREVGNRDPAIEMRFIRKHGDKMPRTMLRYAIEKFPENRRRAILAGKY